MRGMGRARTNDRNRYTNVSADDKSKENQSMGATKIFLKSCGYIWPRHQWKLRVDLVMSLLSLLCANLCDLSTPIALKYTINQLTVQNNLFPFWAIISYGSLRFAGNFFTQLRDVFFASVSAETERRAAVETFQHLQQLSLSFHLKRETGKILRSVSRGSQSFSSLVRIVIFQFIPVIFQVTVVCIYLITYYTFYYSLITFTIISVYVIFTIVTTKFRDTQRRHMNEKDNQMNQITTDSLMNYETVKYFNAEQHEVNRFKKSIQEYTESNIKVQQSLALLNSGQNLIISLGILCAMYLAGKQVISGVINVGDFVLIQQFILQLYLPLNYLGTYYRMIRQSIVDVESMFELIAESVDITDAENADTLVVTQGKIEFKNVNFSYDKNTDKPTQILKNLTFTVEPGSRVAIVGASGQGKSTIMRLIYRFYEIDSGEILIDGHNIQDVTQASLRENIGIVPQDTSLFNDTIEYNIAYGKVGYSSDKQRRPASKAEIIDAAKKSQIYNFIDKQHNKFADRVGERGMKLSGGEKQRISIARALLKNPRIMIFDEATSSLDTFTEKQILEQLENNFINTSDKQFTVLSIAHRLSTIANSDKILVLDSGAIAESGTHTELLQKNGLYAKMWFKQERRNQLAAELDRSASPMPSSESTNSLQSAISITIDDAKESQPNTTSNDTTHNNTFSVSNNNTQHTNGNGTKKGKNKNAKKLQIAGNQELSRPLLDGNSENDSADNKV